MSPMLCHWATSFRQLGLMVCFSEHFSQNELEDILSLDEELLNDVYQYSVPPIRHLPGFWYAQIWLKDYLTDRGAGGATVVQWYHREFSEVAEQRYLSNKENKWADFIILLVLGLGFSSAMILVVILQCISIKREELIASKKSIISQPWYKVLSVADMQRRC